MRAVVQRVTRASVSSGGRVLGAIERGALVLVAVGATDDGPLVERMADKIAALRYFDDDDGRTNVALAQAGGSLLVVSQFTLYADLRRGRRPSFTDAAVPDVAERLVDRFVERLRTGGLVVESGRFGAAMQVELTNDGPFTLILDSDRDLASR